MTAASLSPSMLSGPVAPMGAARARATAAHPPAPRPFVPSASWTPVPARRGAALLVLALHLGALAPLWQAGRHVVARLQPQALSVSLLAARPEPAPPVTAPKPLASLPVAVTPATVVPVPEFTPATAVRDAAPPPAAPAATAAAEPTALRAVAPSLAPIAPKPVAAGSLRYRVEPAVEVPRLSRRAAESGSVVLRVVFDVEGRPREIQLLRSSGFARLDAQAREAMQSARIEPYVEAGRPIEVVASATLEYELN